MTHALLVTQKVEFDGDSHFLNSSEEMFSVRPNQVKLGQIFKFSIFLQILNTCLSYMPTLLGFHQISARIPPKCYFSRITIKMQKLCLQSDIITFTIDRFDHCKAENNDIALKIGMLVACALPYSTYSVFWIVPKFWILTFIF